MKFCWRSTRWYSDAVNLHTSHGNYFIWIFLANTRERLSYYVIDASLNNCNHTKSEMEGLIRQSWSHQALMKLKMTISGIIQDRHTYQSLEPEKLAVLPSRQTWHSSWCIHLHLLLKGNDWTMVNRTLQACVLTISLEENFLWNNTHEIASNAWHTILRCLTTKPRLWFPRFV